MNARFLTRPMLSALIAALWLLLQQSLALPHLLTAVVLAIEGAVVEWLDSRGVSAYGKPAAPGVYVRRGGVEAKIAALGLKVRRGCTQLGRI